MCGGLTSYIWFLFIIITVLIQFVVMCSNSQALYYSHDYPLNLTAEGFDSYINSTDFTNEDNEQGLGVYMYLLDAATEQVVEYEKVNQFIRVAYVDQKGIAVNSQ